MKSKSEFEHIDEAISDFVRFLKKDKNVKYLKTNFEYVIFENGTIVKIEKDDIKDSELSLNVNPFLDEDVKVNFKNQISKKTIEDHAPKLKEYTDKGEVTCDDLIELNLKNWKNNNCVSQLKAPTESIRLAYSRLMRINLNEIQVVEMPLSLAYKTVLFKVNSSPGVVVLSCIPGCLETIRKYYTNCDIENDYDMPQKCINAISSAHRLLGSYHLESDFILPNVYAYISKDLKINKVTN